MAFLKVRKSDAGRMTPSVKNNSTEHTSLMTSDACAGGGTAATGGAVEPVPVPEQLAEPKASLGVLKLAAITFFAVCGGPFGLEPLIKNGGAQRGEPRCHSTLLRST
jgi:hypothetical protein